MALFYQIGTVTMKALLLAFSRWQVEGRENVPPSGPLIIVANHLSLADPPLLSASIPRRITFMAKEELFHSWGGVFVRAFGAFPVRRGELDRGAIRQALEVLEGGRALGMFPEGGRSSNIQLKPASPGTALVAARSGAPILPVGICGSEGISGIGIVSRRPRFIVTIGRPFSIPKARGKLAREQVIQATEFIMRQIAELLPQSYRGYYGD